MGRDQGQARVRRVLVLALDETVRGPLDTRR